MHTHTNVRAQRLRVNAATLGHHRGAETGSLAQTAEDVDQSGTRGGREQPVERGLAEASGSVNGRAANRGGRRISDGTLACVARMGSLRWVSSRWALHAY
ncbi:hypothetical protein MRX96_059104 [Rhipicephalus microplus]